MQWVEPLESGRFDQSEIREHILRMARFMFSCVRRARDFQGHYNLGACFLGRREDLLNLFLGHL